MVIFEEAFRTRPVRRLRLVAFAGMPELIRVVRQPGPEPAAASGSAALLKPHDLMAVSAVKQVEHPNIAEHIGFLARVARVVD